MIYFFFREASDPYAGGPDIMYMSTSRLDVVREFKAYCKEYGYSDPDEILKNEPGYHSIWIEGLKLNTRITKW